MDHEDQSADGFGGFGLDSRVLSVLEGMGYEKPSPIQAAAIPALLSGRDVVGLAQTGTGKTAAFALPVLSKFTDAPPEHRPSCLVVTPTRELAVQVAGVVATYAQNLQNFHVLSVYGGAPYGPQLAALRRGVDMVVGTPGRILDHIERGSLDLSKIHYLVLDEADEMLHRGFAEEITTIMEKTAPQKQVALFSATMPSRVRHIAQKYLVNPLEIAVDTGGSVGKNITQKCMEVPAARKHEALQRLLGLAGGRGVIVFARTKAAVEQLAESLVADGHRAAAITGNIPQRQREQTVEDLRAGRIDILVATDVAARGLDVERIELVVNYDMPRDAESYVHRIGRTGRAGRGGEAIVFVTPRERSVFRTINRAMKNVIRSMPVPTVQEINAARLEKHAEDLTQVLEHEHLGDFQHFVEQYAAEQKQSVATIAAALFFLAQGKKPLLLTEADLPEMAKPSSRREETRAPRSSEKRQAKYRIAVGKKDGVLPGTIVGALTSGGSLASGQIGAIDIRHDYAVVELPAFLRSEQWNSLAKIRIAGAPIHLEALGKAGRGPRGNMEERGKGRNMTMKSRRFPRSYA